MKNKNIMVLILLCMLNMTVDVFGRYEAKQDEKALRQANNYIVAQVLMEQIKDHYDSVKFFKLNAIKASYKAHRAIETASTLEEKMDIAYQILRPLDSVAWRQDLEQKVSQRHEGLFLGYRS